MSCNISSIRLHCLQKRVETGLKRVRYSVYLHASVFGLYCTFDISRNCKQVYNYQTSYNPCIFFLKVYHCTIEGLA